MNRELILGLIDAINRWHGSQRDDHTLCKAASAALPALQAIVKPPLPWAGRTIDDDSFQSEIKRMADEAVERALGPQRQALRKILRDMQPQLFRIGQFVLHSGELSNFKIDCEALYDHDLEALASLIGQRVTFSEVEGVPTGGLRLQRALEPYRSVSGPLLIVDDVMTTGASMEEQRAGRSAIGFVIFARGVVPLWITPVFTMHL